MCILVILSFLAPILGGIVCYFLPDRARKLNHAIVFISLLLGAAMCAVLGISGDRGSFELFSMTDTLRVTCMVDNMSLFFGALFSFAFLIVAIYSLSYFSTDEKKHRFDCFCLLSYGMLMALCFAGNLLTMYFFFEMVTLCSVPLVLHEKTAEANDAAQKYLIYSVGGAFLGFIGVVYMSMDLKGSGFTYGGALSEAAAQNPAFQAILLLMLIGFGAKCGLFPLHNWLPTAHPVAPAPASALLSGIITKSGIIAVIRIVYYVVGPEMLRGTWVHQVWLILILATILLGSFMAVIQKNFKRRLAYSTVSQVSYVLLGIAVLSPDGFQGAFLQIISHALIKIGLFLVAGVLIHCLGRHNVDELDGCGKQMPITMICYTLCALGLVGVPPTIGFTAKWYLVTGAMGSGLGGFEIAAPIVLILSAILTAYYLLSCAISAFFPANRETVYPRVKEPIAMVLPLVVLACLTVLMGIFASPILSVISQIR